MDLAAAQIEADFPCWHVWRGVSGLWYARRPRSSPPVVVRAKTTGELRDRICAKLVKRGQAALAAAERLGT